MSSDDFGDLLAANHEYGRSFELGDLRGAARAGVGLVTCMDARIDPLKMLGLAEGDALTFRNPGGRVTPQAVEAMVLGVHLLEVTRIMVVPHTGCAMAASTQEQVRERVGASAGQDASWLTFGVVGDQRAALEDDVRTLRAHPLIPQTVPVGGFLYDVRTGLLDRLL